MKWQPICEICKILGAVPDTYNSWSNQEAQAGGLWVWGSLYIIEKDSQEMKEYNVHIAHLSKIVPEWAVSNTETFRSSLAVGWANQTYEMLPGQLGWLV